MNDSILIGVTGASGTIWAQILADFLRSRVSRVYLVFTDTARQVALHELPEVADGLNLRHYLKSSAMDPEGKIVVFHNKDFFAPIASGSSAPRRMVVVPGSMGTIARIAGGISSNLLERTADVMLKERRPLILVPRETPFSTLHLENLLKLSQMGAVVVPPMPAYYQKPDNLADMNRFIVGKICEALGYLDHGLYTPWAETRR
jgi:4-hydroxy-3-polyprenylbenzoate decarboxylase